MSAFKRHNIRDFKIIRGRTYTREIVYLEFIVVLCDAIDDIDGLYAPYVYMSQKARNFHFDTQTEHISALVNIVIRKNNTAPSHPYTEMWSKYLHKCRRLRAIRRRKVVTRN